MRVTHAVEVGNAIYAVNSPCVTSTALGSSVLLRFHQVLCRLERRIKDDQIDDEMVLAPIRRLRQFRFEACCVPVDFGDEFFWRKQSPSGLIEQIALCGRLYPDLQPSFAEMIRSTNAVILDPISELRLKVVEMCLAARRNSVSVLVCESRFALPLQRFLKSGRSVWLEREVLTPTMMRGDDVYDRVIVVGAPRWYPDHVFCASRATSLEIVNFNWLHDDWKPQSMFGGFDNVTGTPSGTVVSTRIELISGWTRPTDILPATSQHSDLVALAGNLQRDAANQRDSESLDMRLFTLENGLAVFLEELESARIRVLGVEAGLGVDNVGVTDVCPGAFLLLRTRGGGDYIASVADRLMGDQCTERRARQELWKTRFRSEVTIRGIEAVRKGIAKVSGHGVSVGQIKYWMWSGSISPQKPVHFESLLDVVGLTSIRQQCLEDVIQLRHFHQKAGREISGRLVCIVEKADLRELTRTGVMEFSLEEEEGGSITAIRVIERTGVTAYLPARRARQLFDLEDRLWQE